MKLLKANRRSSAALVLSQVLRGVAVLAPAVAATLLLPSPAAAQGTGVVTGTVRDASTKAPLADVVVTVTSPQMQGEQTVVTDSSGSYRIGSLPPGDYTIHLDKEGYKPGGRGGVTLRVDATIRANMELLPEGLKSEEIVVVGKAPTVDIGSSSTGVNVNSNFTDRIPLNAPGARNGASRSFEDVANVAPGAKGDDYGVSVSGTTSMENQYLIDGLSVNDPGFGLLATPLSLEFIDQVGVITGGYMPEYGRATGGILDAVTKSGSNEFHGSAFTAITPGSFEGPKKNVFNNADSESFAYHYAVLEDFGATVGGPIIKDKLWFFAGVDMALNRYRIDSLYNYKVLNPDGSEILNSTGQAKSKPIPNSTQTNYAQGTVFQFFAKLTYNINQDNHIALSFAAAPQRSGGNGLYGVDNQLLGPQGVGAGPYNAYAQIFYADSYDTVLKYTSSWDNKKWLLDATLGWHHEHVGRTTADGATPGANNPGDQSGDPGVQFDRSSPSVHSLTDFQNIPGAGNNKYCRLVGNGPNGPQPTCPASIYDLGGPGFVDDALLDRYQGKAVLTRLIQAAGHHVIKGGVDIELLSYNHRSAYTGGDFLQEADDGSYFQDFRQYGALTAPDQLKQFDYYDAESKSTTVGGFVQDSWSIMDKVTVNAGVRYDGQFIYGTDGRTGLFLPEEWSPRVGFVWDPTHEGKAKLFANYARFYEGVPLDIADRSFPGQTTITGLHDPAACTPTGARVTAACGANSSLFHNVQGSYSPTQNFYPAGADPEAVDPDLHPQSNDEWVFGGEYEIFEDGVLGLSFTHRYQNYVVEDMSNDESNTYFIGNPGYGIAKDFPKAVRNYDALSLYFTKAFAHEWLAQASYTVSYLRGNWAGLYRPETLQLDPNINSDFDLRSLLPNREGPLPGDHTHAIKVFLAKDFRLPSNWIVQVGGNFFASSGAPTNYLGNNFLYGDGEVFILPRGSGPRLPWAFDIDSHLGAGYRINKDSQITLSMDIFNLFDFQAVTSIDENFTFAPVSPLGGGKTSDVKGCEGPKAPGNCPLNDPTTSSPWKKSTFNSNFGQPTSYQQPREFRFNAKVTF